MLKNRLGMKKHEVDLCDRDLCGLSLGLFGFCFTKLKKAEKDDVGIDAGENAEGDAEEKRKADRRKEKPIGERKSRQEKGKLWRPAFT